MAKKASKSAPKKRASRPVMSKTQTRLLEGAMAGGFAFVIGSVFLISSLQNFFMATNQFASVINSVLVDLTNTDRAAYNLGGLTVNQKLVEAAQAKANDMANKSYFAHTSPEGIDSWHWFKEVGYDFQSAGENLAVDFSDSADVQRAWMNSPSHRDNILNGKYTEVGIATASGIYQGHPTVFVVTMFGTPRKVAASSPAPTSEQPEFATVPKNPTETATASNPSSVLGEQTETAPVVTEEIEYRPAAESKPARTQPVVASEPAAESQPYAAQPVAVSPQQPIGAIKRQSDDWQVLATSPSTTLKYSYYLLALLVLLALAVDTGLEIKWHHRKRAATAGFMLAGMAMLFWYANYSMFSHAVVVEAGAAITQSL
jgi:hypothetical protein